MISGIILYLFSASLLFQIIQVGVFPILIAQILSNQGVDGFTIGIFLAISWVAVLLVGPVVPRLIRQTGFNAANASSSLVTGSAVILLLISTAHPVVLLSAILMGIGLIIRWVSCDSLVVELSSTKNRGRMIGLHEALMGLGIAIAPLLFVFFSLDGVLVVLHCYCRSWPTAVFPACRPDIHFCRAAIRQKTYQHSLQSDFCCVGRGVRRRIYREFRHCPVSPLFRKLWPEPGDKRIAGKRFRLWWHCSAATAWIYFRP